MMEKSYQLDAQKLETVDTIYRSYVHSSKNASSSTLHAVLLLYGASVHAFACLKNAEAHAKAGVKPDTCDAGDSPVTRHASLLLPYKAHDDDYGLRTSASSMVQPQTQMQPEQLSRRVARATTGVTIGGSLILLCGLTLTATVIGLVIITPLLVIFSPILVPAALALFSIMAGFVSSGGFGAVASFIFYWMYRYVLGKKPPVDRFREKFEKSEQQPSGR